MLASFHVLECLIGLGFFYDPIENSTYHLTFLPSHLRGINFISNVITTFTTYLESWASIASSLAFQFLFNQHFFIASFGSHWCCYFPFPMAIESNFEPLAPYGKWVFSIFRTPHWETNQTSLSMLKRVYDCDDDFENLPPHDFENELHEF